MKYLENYNLWKQNVSDKELQELLSIENNDTEIKERFSLPLSFGTAGMRGVVGMGTAMLNEYTVARATQGLANYIVSLGARACEKGVVVSFDTRRFSFEFALCVARVLSQNGVRAFLFEDVRPVPMCSFAIRELACVAGVMITASHNPKEYNGYKVYGDDGAQMSPDATEKVVGYINSIDDYFGVKMSEVATQNHAEIKGQDGLVLDENITVIGKRIDEKYFAELEKLSLSPKAVAEVCNDLKIVYTPIHGSGKMPVVTILGRMNIPCALVAEQSEPDTEFSTVSVPNPEQPDALKLGIKLAGELGSDIVIGTDPDCDRMGVAVKNELGEYVLLNGNQIGAMLMDYILLRNKENKTLPKNAAVVKTIVTTRLADSIAKSYGVQVFDVLTGFKFIGEKIKEWETNKKHTFMFGYEESFGYLNGTHARDKDAVVSTMLFAEMACYYKSKGKTIYDRLQEIFAQHGYFSEKSISIAFKGLDGMDKMTAIMEKLRNNPPAHFAQTTINAVLDYQKSLKTDADGKTQTIDLPKTNVLQYDLGGGEWVAVRPSGTEPKLKIYVSTRGESMAEAQVKADVLIENVSPLIK